MATFGYQAIPAESSFYSRFQQSIAFRVLSANLFYEEGAVFDLFQDDPEAFNDFIEATSEDYPNLFCGTELETSLLIDDFREAMQVTCLDYPQIVDLDCSIGGFEFDERLKEELLRRNFNNAEQIVGNLLNGDEEIEFPDNIILPLSLISREAIRKGAAALRQIELEILFPSGDNNKECLDFKEWREFCLLAADLNTAALTTAWHH
jgi:hypothetical protein